MKDATGQVGRMAVEGGEGEKWCKKIEDLDRMARMDRANLPGYEMIVVVGL